MLPLYLAAAGLLKGMDQQKRDREGLIVPATKERTSFATGRFSTPAETRVANPWDPALQGLAGGFQLEGAMKKADAESAANLAYAKAMGGPEAPTGAAPVAPGTAPAAKGRSPASVSVLSGQNPYKMVPQPPRFAADDYAWHSNPWAFY